jgi:hypothetical protein
VNRGLFDMAAISCPVKLGVSTATLRFEDVHDLAGNED